MPLLPHSEYACAVLISSSPFELTMSGYCSVVPYGYTVEPMMTGVPGPESSSSAEPSRSPLGESTCESAKGQVRPEQSASCQFG